MRSLRGAAQRADHRNSDTDEATIYTDERGLMPPLVSPKGLFQLGLALIIAGALVRLAAYYPVLDYLGLTDDFTASGKGLLVFQSLGTVLSTTVLPIGVGLFCSSFVLRALQQSHQY